MIYFFRQLWLAKLKKKVKTQKCPIVELSKGKVTLIKKRLLRQLLPFPFTNLLSFVDN